MAKKLIVWKVGRDSINGKLIPVKEALKRPNTTTVETMKRKA